MADFPSSRLRNEGGAVVGVGDVGVPLPAVEEVCRSWLSMASARDSGSFPDEVVLAPLRVMAASVSSLHFRVSEGQG